MRCRLRSIWWEKGCCKFWTMKIEIVDILTVAGQQVIHIPDDLRIDDEKVYFKKTGNVIMVVPFRNPWQNLYNSLSSFSSDFMDERQPVQ